MKKTALFATRDPSLASRLAGRYSLEVLGQVPSYDLALSLAHQLQPDLVFVGEGLIPTLHPQRPAVSFEFVVKYVPARERVVALSHRPASLASPNGRVVAVDLGSPVDVDGLASLLGLERASGEHLLCVLYSARGGVGKTTVAANLGLLCGRAGLEAAVLDLDLSGSLRYLLGLGQERASFYELLRREQVLGDDLLAYAHRLEGCDWYLAPVNGLGAASYTFLAEDKLRQLLRVLRSRYALALVDLPAADLAYNWVQLVALEEASRVLFVTVPSPAAAAAALDHARLLKELGHLGKTGLLANKARDALDWEGQARALGLELWGVVPYDPAAYQADLDGTGLDQSSRAYRALAKAAARMARRELAGGRAQAWWRPLATRLGDLSRLWGRRGHG